MLILRDLKIMNEDYQIVCMDKPDDAAWHAIGGGLHDYNKQQAGDNQFQQLCFLLRSPGQEIAGGLIGEIHWGWLFINLLFVKDELRGQGYGHRLLTLAEEEARRARRHPRLPGYLQLPGAGLLPAARLPAIRRAA